MHEWALADALVSTAISVAKKENLKEITRIVVKVGELQQINIETFEFLVKEVIGNDPLIKKAKLDIETEKGHRSRCPFFM